MREPRDITELVFENKNKDYGAYELRRSKVRNTSLSFTIAVLLVFSGFVTPWIWYRIALEKEKNTAQKPVVQKKIVSYSELSAPPPIEMIKPPSRQVVLKKKSTVKFLTPVAKPDEEVPEELDEIPTMDDMARIDPGVTTVEGDSLAYEVQEVDEVLLDGGPSEPIKVYDFVEKMPQFPGGEEALLKFIYSNIEYPKIALEYQIEGMVAAQFIIGTNGKVRDIIILRSLEPSCDEEVIRVIKMLPDWEPGYQFNRAVPVKYVLPVKFKILE